MHVEGVLWLVFVKDDLDMVCEASKAIAIETEMENNGIKQTELLELGQITHSAQQH